METTVGQLIDDGLRVRIVAVAVQELVESRVYDGIRPIFVIFRTLAASSPSRGTRAAPRRVLRTAGLRKGKSDKVIRRDRGEERLGRRDAGYLPPLPEVTPHPVPLADGVDHDQPYLAMASDDRRLPSIVCPSYSIDSVGTPQSPLSDSKFIAMLQLCR
ncbi:MAG TPA: hypothetical protein VJV41_15670 [Mycobacterium sp.]|nr:hypothetical protein [Mycobacterium sp.]HKP42403.1 hypothetical protein [Mycobacterium sp.]